MPTMSPRTQQFQAGAGAGVDQSTQLFEQGFSQMAYNVLTSKFPDVMQDVVTFKILDSDLDSGTGVGAFVVMRHDNPLYIPVVMSDNNIKPIELVYHKALNIFMPLSKQWLEELDKTSLTAMGKGVKTPETLYSDVDIRNVVVPPLTGRFSYAAWEPVILADVAKVLNKNTIEKVASEPKLVLLDFLARAPNRVKQSFARTLEKHARILKTAARIYGVTALTTALRPTVEKTAAKQHFGGALWIADKDTKPAEFKRVFGDRAAEAYSGVRLNGYAAKDTRTSHNLALQEQTTEAWTAPGQPGVYVLFGVDGKEKPALVVPHPVDLFGGHRYDLQPVSHARSSHHITPDYLAVFPDGDYLRTSDLAGRASTPDEISGSTLYTHVFGDAAGAPRQGKGFFVRQRGASITATMPLQIKSISKGSDGVRRIEAESIGGYDSKTIVTQEKGALGEITTPKDAGIAYLPNDYVWVPLKAERKRNEFFRSVHDLARDAYQALASAGAKKVAVKNAGYGLFSIDGRQATDRVKTLKKLAYDYSLPVSVAEVLIKSAEANRRADAWIASGGTLARAQMKLSADEKSDSKPPRKEKKESAPPADDGGGGGGDPSMGGGDPSMDPSMGMAAPPPPPPPSPTDMAAAEMDQHIQQEMQKLVEKQQMLQALTARANEIAGGAPMLPTIQNQMMGAPPPSANLATGQPTMGMGQPGPGMNGPMGAMGGGMGGGDPSMMGGQGALPQSPPMGGMPGGDPSMGGGMDPSMGGMPSADQSMGGMPGMDPSMGGMDPSMQQPPPGAMMGEDGPSDGDIGSEVNPQFMDQASALNSDDVFDAAAVSSLAQSPAVKEMVAQYLPNLEKALDNIGRVQLSLWMQEPVLKEEIGEQAFGDLEESLRSTLKSMGNLVLKLSQGAQAIKGQYDGTNA